MICFVTSRGGASFSHTPRYTRGFGDSEAHVVALIPRARHSQKSDLRKYWGWIRLIWVRLMQDSWPLSSGTRGENIINTRT